MKKHGKSPKRIPGAGWESEKKETLRPCFEAAFGCLLGMTFFLSGEQVERSGFFHLPCILWLLAATVWLLLPSVAGNRDTGSPRFHFSQLDLIVYGFFALVVVSIFWNLLPGHGGGPRPSLNMLSVWLALASAWFLFRQLLRTPESVGAALAVVLAVVLGEASTGIYQQYIDIPAMQRQFENDPQGTVALVDSSIVSGTPEWDRLLSRLKTAGPMGTYSMTNSLGGFLGTWLVFLLGFIAYRRGVKPERSEPAKGTGLRNAFFLLMIGIVLLCFVLTKCRSAYVAVFFGIGLLTCELLRRRSSPVFLRRFLLSGLVAVVLVGGFAVFTKGKSVLAGAKRSLGFRLEYWEASIGMIRDYPILGCGSGNFKQTYTRYKLAGSSEEIADPHNFPVEIAAVSGLPALFLFLSVFFAVPVARFFLHGALSKRPPPPSPEPFPETTDTGKSNAPLFWGGLAGCWLALFFSYNSEAPMDPVAPLFASISFIVVRFVFLAGKDGRVQEIPSPLLAVTLLVLAVHLLAAGGISVTSTAINFWLLTAILVNRKSDRGLEPGRGIRFGLAVCLVVVMLFVYRTGMLPVLRSRSVSMLAVEENRDLVQKIRLLREAAAADPLSAMAREESAAGLYRLWLADPKDARRKEDTLREQDETVKLLPRSAGYRFVFAERLAIMYEKTGDAELRDKAGEFYRDAIRLYPNHAKFRAPYALFLLRTAGENPEELPEKRKEAVRQRNRALRLDEGMSHADQKLSPEIREQLSDPRLWPLSGPE